MKPTRIGKYTAFEKIGRGSTSEVYKAYDPILNRFVAIKTIAQGAGINEEIRARFYREAQSAARLTHPNIITIYELGEDQQWVFIVMELLVGCDLKHFIQDRKSLTLDQKLELLQQVAAGVGFAHSKGIVHRDLKPGNIHVQSSNQVKIMDFGLARLASSGITRSGMVMGTPNYMSPEQVRGETVDITSDVFSMGAILYELFSFKKPFQAVSLHETMMRVMRGEREPLSKVVPRIHPALAEIVDKALALEPHDRYRNGNELFEALSEARNELVSAKKSSPDTQIDLISKDQSSADTQVGEKESSRSLRTPQPSSSNIPLFRSLSGSLKAMHLADVLQWCAIKSKTGTLRVRYGPIEKKLLFRDGNLFSSSTNSPRETLGQFLIRLGKINEEQLFKALLEQEMVREPLGRILIDAGLVGESELQRLLQLKCKESIYDCFLWTDGVFAFADDELPEAIPVSFSLDIAVVIQEGLERMDRWEAIRRKFSSRLTTFALNRPNLERMSPHELTEEQNKILDLVERGKNLAEIALELHAIDFYAASRLLELCQLGLIDVREVPDELPYERQVEELRERLAEGLKYFKWGQHTEALAAFEAALEIDPHSKAHLFVEKIHRIVDDKKAEPAIPLDDIPRLKVPWAKLDRQSLAPQEGFVLSRVSGDWSVRSILKICPMSEEEVLKIFRHLMDEGLVELHPAQ